MESTACQRQKLITAEFKRHDFQHYFVWGKELESFCTKNKAVFQLQRPLPKEFRTKWKKQAYQALMENTTLSDMEMNSITKCVYQRHSCLRSGLLCSASVALLF